VKRTLSVAKLQVHYCHKLRVTNTRIFVREADS